MSHRMCCLWPRPSLSRRALGVHGRQDSGSKGTGSGWGVTGLSCPRGSSGLWTIVLGEATLRHTRGSHTALPEGSLWPHTGSHSRVGGASGRHHLQR